MTFGGQIKQKREELGMTQEELAEKLNVSRQAISKWESDLSAPTGTNKSALCALLGLENEKQPVPRTLRCWLYGGWAATLLLAVTLALVLVAWNGQKTPAGGAIGEGSTSVEETAAITDLRFVDANCEFIEAGGDGWYSARDIRGVLITYTGSSPETVKLLAVPTGTEMTEYTELWLMQDILTDERFILLPLDLSGKSENGLMVHFYAEIRFDSQTTVFSDLFNLYAE